MVRKIPLCVLVIISMLILFPHKAGARIRNQEMYPVEHGIKADYRDQVEQIISASRHLFKNNLADSAIQSMLEALKLSSRRAYRRGMDTAIAYLLNYSVQWERDLISTSHAEIFQKALDYLKPYKGYSLQIAALHNGLGGYFFSKGGYAQGLLEYEKALKAIQGRTGQPELNMQTNTYTNLSAAWTVMGEEQAALDALDKANEIALRQNDIHRQISLLQHKGVLFFNSGKLDSAYHYLNASYALSTRYPDKHPAGCHCRQYTIANLCQVLIQQHQPDRALQLVNETIHFLEQERLQKMEKGFKQGKLSKLSAFFYYIKGYAYYEKKNYKQAESILIPLLSLVQQEGISGSETNIHEILSAVYQATRQYKKAYQHKEAYARLSVNQSINKEKSKLLSLHYTIEKDKELARVQLTIARQRSEIREKNFWIIAILLSVLLLITLVLAIFRNHYNKQQLQQAYILNLLQQQEIDKLQARVEGEEQERSRLAQELHDGIVSQLLAIRLKVNGLQVKAQTFLSPGDLTEVASQLEEATRDLRHTAHNLLPDLLLRQGLLPAVATLCESINRTTGLEVDFQTYGQMPALAQETELTLYRMLQELIQNVLKHAGATELLIQFSYREELLCITVEDNGRGIPAKVLQQHKRGNGLQNLQRRVDLLHGRLDIKSEIGNKTTVYLEFDLKCLT